MEIDRVHVLAEYQKFHEKYGLSPHGVGWTSGERQERRFRSLTEDMNQKRTIRSVLDVGCGYGDLVQHLRWNRPNWFRHLHYYGVDFNKMTLDVAQERFGDLPNVDFMLADIHGSAGPETDLVLASGLLAIYNDVEQDELVADLWKVAKKALAFNFLDPPPSDHVTVLSRCWNYLRTHQPEHWVIKHDYLDDDTTLVMWKVDPYG